VAELAQQVGRDPSTVSRQIAKLKELGLVSRQTGQQDLRVRAAKITRAGTKTVDIIASARRRLLHQLLQDWSEQERETFSGQLRKFADALLEKHKMDPAG
jgi:DNA-binding MarR family transcriptional regulator